MTFKEHEVTIYYSWHFTTWMYFLNELRVFMLSFDEVYVYMIKFNVVKFQEAVYCSDWLTEQVTVKRDLSFINHILLNLINCGLFQLSKCCLSRKV